MGLVQILRICTNFSADYFKLMVGFYKPSDLPTLTAEQMASDEKNAERHTQRELREVHRVDKIKTEATEELEAFIIHPAPMPLRQVLAGTKRPVGESKVVMST